MPHLEVLRLTHSVVRLTLPTLKIRVATAAQDYLYSRLTGFVAVVRQLYRSAVISGSAQ